MTSPTDERDETLAVLACTIGARPAGAPSLEEIAASVTASARPAAGVLEVRFAATACEMVAEAVAAERLCCPEIGWELALEPEPLLRISGTPAQIVLLGAMLRRREALIPQPLLPLRQEKGGLRRETA